MPRTKSNYTYWLGGILLVSLLATACAPSAAPTPAASTTPFPPATHTSLAPTEQPPSTAQPTEPVSPTAWVVKAVEFPDPAEFGWTEVVSGLNRPVGLTSAGDGTGRLFIIEQPGQILIHTTEGLLESPFLDIRDRVGNSGSEQGLLGLAFHPDYENNGYFYVNYTDNGGNSVISRFSVSSNPDQADSASESRVLSFAQPYQNHNGGQISFGPQGYLWIASGDGGGSGDPRGNAQNTDNPLGKLLRIDINQEPFAIPEDNPFDNEIWAYGLRNPWRFTFDPASGDLYIADVGQNQWEEINFLASGAPAGVNFGWNFLEGNHPFQGSPPQDLKLTNPIWEYDHAQGCSVSGGAVYRGSLPEWQGIYLYSDFCSGLVWGLLQTSAGEWQNLTLFQTDRRIAAVDQDQNGEVYLVDIRGAILKLVRQ